MLMGIIIYTDKTGTDKYQRYSSEPVIFTVTLLSRAARNRSTSWRPLGFIPAFDSKSSAQKEVERNIKGCKSLSVENYHNCLKKILDSLVEVQKTGITTDLMIGKEKKK